MAVIGNIVIGLSTNTSEFEKGLAKAASALATFAGKAAVYSAKAVTELAKIGAQGALAAGGALTAFALTAGKALDETGDAADRLGTTTENLLALRYAAKLTGTETESLDKALEKLNVNLGKAATEGGPVADTLTRLGLNARVLAEQDPTKTFVDITATLQKVPNTAERAAIAMELFGKGGVAVLGSIKAGPEELTRLSDEFKAFGGVTESTRQNIGSMFDAFDRIGSIIGAVGVKLAGEFAPLVIAAGEELAHFAAQGVDTSSIIASSMQWITEAAATVADVIQYNSAAFKALQSIVTEVISTAVRGFIVLADAAAYAYSKITGKDVDLTSGLVLFADELDKLTASQIEDANKIANAGSYGDKVRETFARIRSEAASAKSSIDGMATSVGKITPALEKVGEANAKVFEQMKSDAARFTEQAQTPLEKFQAEQAKLQDLLKAGLVSQQTVERLQAKGLSDLKPGDSKESNKPRFAAALDLGSREARSADLAFRFASTNGARASDEPAKKTAANTARTVSLMTEQNVLMTNLITTVRAKVQSIVDPVF